MIVFFDTSVHVALLRGELALETVLTRVGGGPIRLSPVVASELFRGAKGHAARSIEKLTAHLVTVEPPSWRQCWLDAGRIVRRIFPDHEDIGLARLQNDILLALTARHTGAVLVTSDQHFTALRRTISFRCVTLSESV